MTRVNTDRLIELLQGGCSIQGAAREMGESYSTVYCAYRRLLEKGLVPNKSTKPLTPMKRRKARRVWDSLGVVLGRSILNELSPHEAAVLGRETLEGGYETAYELLGELFRDYAAEMEAKRERERDQDAQKEAG